MGESKSIGQLLKELDAMQKQFNHLNEELIVENRKKKRIKTELSSNEIDDDFFKTFSAPLIEKNTIKKEQEKITEKDLTDDELLFELELEQETVKASDSAIESILSKEEVIEEKKSPEFSENAEVKIVSNEKKLSTQTKNVEIENEKIDKLRTAVNEKKTEINDYSYLTIKQRLEKIQQEIGLKEEALKEIKYKNKQQAESKVIALKQQVSANVSILNKNVVLKNNKLSNKSSVLEPAKQANATIEKPKKKKKDTQLNTKSEVTSSAKLINKKGSPLNPTKVVKTKSVDNNINVGKASIIKKEKVSNQKEKKTETVDQLTILILILLIVLLVTAWVLLF